MARDLNGIVAFLAVVDACSFTAAAKSLGVPTSTVSCRVSGLEEALGVRLLQRTTRKLALTGAGQTYYQGGARALRDLTEIENRLADEHETPTGRVRVLAPVAKGITDVVVAEFLAEYPRVRVEIEFATRDVNIVQEGYDVMPVFERRGCDACHSGKRGRRDLARLATRT